MALTESPVSVNSREGEVQGQAQVTTPYTPSDGKHVVHESVTVTDYVVLDANSDLAVQVPEGVGASTYGHRSPLAEALERGTVEDQFAKAADEDSENSGRQVNPESTATTSTEEAVNTDSPDEQAPVAA